MKFRVNKKPNQALKLTSREEDTGKQRIDKVYPEHAEALFIADVAPETDFPILGDLWRDDDERREIGKKLKKQYKLSWSRISLAYQQFPNLREKFQGNLMAK
eukprot:12266027-Ditylum_brightwellii.AAC.1